MQEDVTTIMSIRFCISRIVVADGDCTLKRGKGGGLNGEEGEKETVP
jgi:hypothetical protein